MNDVMLRFGWQFKPDLMVNGVIGNGVIGNGIIGNGVNGQRHTVVGCSKAGAR